MLRQKIPGVHSVFGFKASTLLLWLAEKQQEVHEVAPCGNKSSKGPGTVGADTSTPTTLSVTWLYSHDQQFLPNTSPFMERAYLAHNWSPWWAGWEAGEMEPAVFKGTVVWQSPERWLGDTVITKLLPRMLMRQWFYVCQKKCLQVVRVAEWN
jgi:hypothetical protein